MDSLVILSQNEIDKILDEIKKGKPIETYIKKDGFSYKEPNTNETLLCTLQEGSLDEFKGLDYVACAYLSLKSLELQKNKER